MYILWKCTQITIELHTILNLLPQQFLRGKRTFHCRVLKPVACVELIRKAADEIRIIIFNTSEQRMEMSL
jgi:hypothetical protein